MDSQPKITLDATALHNVLAAVTQATGQATESLVAQLAAHRQQGVLMMEQVRSLTKQVKDLQEEKEKVFSKRDRSDFAPSLLLFAQTIAPRGFSATIVICDQHEDKASFVVTLKENGKASEAQEANG